MLQYLLCLIVSSLTAAGQQQFYCNSDMPETIVGVSEGIIMTRNAGTQSYGDEFDCVWKINATENQRIQLTIESLELGWSPQYTTCTGHDNLQVLEGYTENSPVLTSICHARNPFSIVSQGQFLYLRFTSTHQNFGIKKGIDIKFKLFDNSSCPPDWFQVSSCSTDCLMIGHTGRADWSQAQDICTTNRANLASILSESEFNTILEHGRNVSSSLSAAWIGLSDSVQEGTFKWLDKHPLSYKRDIVGHSYNTHCAVQDFNTENWSVLSCDSKQNYICKANKDGSTTLYQAYPTSKPPVEDAGGSKVFLIVIIIILIISLCVVGCVLLYCLYIRHGNKCSRQNAQSGKQSAAEGRARPHHAVLTPLEPPDSIPSAPPQENVMIHDFQMIAPPTYEEAQLDPVLPANY